MAVLHRGNDQDTTGPVMCRSGAYKRDVTQSGEGQVTLSSSCVSAARDVSQRRVQGQAGAGQHAGDLGSDRPLPATPRFAPPRPAPLLLNTPLCIMQKSSLQQVPFCIAPPNAPLCFVGLFIAGMPCIIFDYPCLVLIAIMRQRDRKGCGDALKLAGAISCHCVSHVLEEITIINSHKTRSVAIRTPRLASPRHATPLHTVLMRQR